MSRSQKIPVDHHLARYVNKQRCVLDESGVPVWIKPAAFELRPAKDGHSAEEWLSTTWLEHASDRSPKEQRVAALEAMRSGKLEPRPSGALAVLHVGKVTQRAKILGKSLRALHEPWLGNGNPAYAPVRGYSAGCQEQFLVDVFVQGGCIETIHIASLL